MKKRILFLTPFLFLLFFFVSLFIPIPQKKLHPAPVISLRLLDRENILLREVLSDEGGRCLWVGLGDISPDLLKATIAAEDRMFFRHIGINVFAVARALVQNVKSGRIVSGASTITQQLVRNIYHFRRDIFSKTHEAWLALRLEHTLSKEEILVQYLNRICYGNQTFGIEAASRFYFDKSAAQLSLAESAFLAGLPRSPSVLNPRNGLEQAVQRQTSILSLMDRLGLADRTAIQRAYDESLQLSPAGEKFKAPHFCDFVLGQYSLKQRQNLSVIRTTCDYSLQEKVNILLNKHVEALENKGITNAATMVLDNHTGEILCMVGSKDFFDSRHDGQVNGALSRRQPGSALKPFTYGLALENGMTAAEIIYDSPVQYSTPEGTYRPRNYDKKFHGPVRLRQALACSYNVPAVSVLETIGPDRLYLQLKDMGFESLDKGPGHYGIGLTLGNGEVTLFELVQAYATLARGGLWLEAKSVLDVCDSDKNPVPAIEQQEQKAVFSPQVAYILTHILSDTDARVPAFGYNSSLALPFPCAVKTGTSKDYRDNWTIGYTSHYTVGVWVGNFDGGSMHNVSGVTGCGPLFRDILLTLEINRENHGFPRIEGLLEVSICPVSGLLADDPCPGAMKEIFVSGTEPQEKCSYHWQKRTAEGEEIMSDYVSPPPADLMIAFPQDGDIFKIDPVLRQNFQTLQLNASPPEHSHLERLEWWINGRREAVTVSPFSYSWKLKPGMYTITAFGHSGNAVMKSRPVNIHVYQ